MLTLRDLCNPRKTDCVSGLSLPASEYLRDMDTDILENVTSEYINVEDEKGQRIGAVKTERLWYLLLKQKDTDFIQMLDSLDVGVVAVDRDSRIFYVNPAYTRILGVETAKILGRYMSIIEPEAALLKVLKTGKSEHIDKRLIKSVNTYVSASMYPLMQNGKPAGAFSIFTDITQLNHLRGEVERISQVAQEYNRQIEEEKLLKRQKVLGQSKVYRDCVNKALKVAPTDAMVLLRGENGSGKEILTGIIRENSARKDRPFITVNCSAIPESLIESELFGYEEGAFTGAVKGGRMGKFQLADGGTLFLDEIGDMPYPMQARLLRVLQEGEIEKVGRQQNIPVDVRVIAATNKPLEQMVKDGRFREDLYYRLNVITIDIPPLRERGNDVILLAEHFLETDNEKYHRQVRFDRPVLHAFLAHDWPGNVRELKNTVESAVVLCDDNLITLDDLPEVFRKAAGNAEKPAGTGENHTGNRLCAACIENYPETAGTLKEQVERYERSLIENALRQCGGDRMKAMEMLGLSRRTFYRKLASCRDGAGNGTK